MIQTIMNRCESLHRYFDARMGPERCGPFFVASDIHKGVTDARDNFAYGDRESQFIQFLDYVDRNNGRLILAGDVFELWQNNISEVLTKSEWLLDRLAKMEAVYVLGNHDADLYYFIGGGWLKHDFFKGMCLSANVWIAGKSFRITHGHEVDPYCASMIPGIGRITAIYSGLAEDRHGGPMLNKYRTVESKVIGRMDRLVDLWHRLTGKPDRFRKMNQELLANANGNIVISGHTHRAGRIEDKLFNTGTWAETTNSFVQIDLDGRANVYDWIDGKAILNLTELPA